MSSLQATKPARRECSVPETFHGVRVTRISASTCMVLPSPISSARQAPRPRLRQKMEPLNATDLIRPQCRMQFFTDGRATRFVGMTNVFERSPQPISGNDARPLQGFFVRNGTCRTGRVGYQSHRMHEAQAVFVGNLLGVAKLIQQLRKLVAIDFDPLTANEVQPAGTREQTLNLCLRERFPVEGNVHFEIHQRLRADTRRRFVADLGGDFGARRACTAPSDRHSHDYARRFQHGDVIQKLKGFGGRPPQRMINLAAVDHLPQPATVF